MLDSDILLQILYYTKSIYLILGFCFVCLIIKCVYNFFSHFIFGGI